MKQLLLEMLKPLVDYGEDMSITETEVDGIKTFVLTVNDADLGKVIGKQGRTAKAVRTILAAASAKKGEKYHFDIKG